MAAIDGSKFKAVNTRDKNFTRATIKRRMEQVEASIERYLAALETADRQEGELAQAKVVRLKDKIAALREQMQAFQALERRSHAAPDQQISLTDPDARAMATSGKGTGMVGYNVQAAVDAKHHLIVAHEVTNVGHDRGQLANMAGQAKAAMGVEALEVLADRGYFNGEEILACEPLGVTPMLPKPLTSGAKADGPVRQAGLRLHRRGRHLSLPRRRDADLALHHGREGHDPARLLDRRMRRLPAEGPLHEQQAAAPDQALGA